MECPRCVTEAGEVSPYRESARAEPVHPRLVREKTFADLEIERCMSCGGGFLEKSALMKIESAARSGDLSKELGKERPGRSVELLQRSYDHARSAADVRSEHGPEKADVKCPRCAESMFEREWSFGTLVFVDVCVDCNGVWVDGGELESIARIFAK